MSDTQTIIIQGAAKPADPDDVLITVGDVTLSGWKSVRITAGIERCPRDFEVTATESYPGAGQIAMRPGDECSVYLGKDRVLTGYVNRYSASINPRGHNVSIAGRGMCQDLVDCAAELDNQQVSQRSVLQVAQLLAKPYGITVAGLSGPPVGMPALSAIIPQLVVMLGETAWEVIERLCRISGLLVYEQADGSLLLSSNPANEEVGAVRDAASGFKEGVNVLDAAFQMSDDQRFSKYSAYRVSFDTLRDVGQGPNLIAVRNDTGVARNRGKVIIMEQGYQLSLQNAADRASWEAARRWGRSHVLRVTTDSWRDKAGKLYEPNVSVPLDLPTLKVQNVRWLISEVTYRKEAGGTLCDLVMMPPEAFAVRPTLPPYPLPADLLPKVTTR